MYVSVYVCMYVSMCELVEIVCLCVCVCVCVNSSSGLMKLLSSTCRKRSRTFNFQAYYSRRNIIYYKKKISYVTFKMTIL
jgi:hypothetical protein